MWSVAFGVPFHMACGEWYLAWPVGCGMWLMAFCVASSVVWHVMCDI